MELPGRSSVTLLAFDFDGTLAAIQTDPSAVTVDPAAAEFLQDAAGVPGVVLAVASGRDCDDLAARIGDIPLYLIGSHGLEIRHPDGHMIYEAEPATIGLDRSIRLAAERCGFRIETKRYGMALHWRGVRHLDARHPVVQRFGEWAEFRGLDVIEGRCVIEARARGGGKEAALRWLASATAARRVIFAGDDYTDYGALRFAGERGLALFVQSDERSAPIGVRPVGSCADLVQIVRAEVSV